MANTPSLLSDVFPAARRGRVLSVFYSAAPIGAAIGVALAGWLAGHYGWRVACVVVGLPGLVAAGLLYRSREPVRGALDGIPAGPAPSFGATLKVLLARPAFIGLVLGFAASVFVQNAVEYWMPTILQRDKAIPIAEANATYGAMVFIAGIVGPLVGATAGDALGRRTGRAYLYVAAIAILGTALPIGLIAASADRSVVFGSVLLEALFGNAAPGLVMAVAMTYVGAEMRGTATAILLTSIHLLGDFISWPLVGALSTSMSDGRLSGLVGAAEWFGIDPGHHLSISLMAVTVPVALLGAVFYLRTAALSSASVTPATP